MTRCKFSYPTYNRTLPMNLQVRQSAASPQIMWLRVVDWEGGGGGGGLFRVGGITKARGACQRATTRASRPPKHVGKFLV